MRWTETFSKPPLAVAERCAQCFQTVMDFKNTGQKIKEELLGRREELTRIDTDDYSNKKYDKLILRNSVTTHIFYIVLPIALIVFFILPDKTGEITVVQLIKTNWFWGTLLALLPLTAVYFGVRGLIDRKPQLTVDTDGIKTNDIELKWEDIIETKFRYLKGKTTLLIIKTSTVEKEIDIGNFNMSPRILGHQIELIKRSRV